MRVVHSTDQPLLREAVHEDGHVPGRHPQGLAELAHACGGDTAFAPHFAEIRRRLGAPTVALVPIGAYQPRWFMENIHMDPADAVRAHQVLGAERSVGIHWGTFDLSDEGRFQPAGELMLALRRAGVPETSFVAAKNGESFLVWLRVRSCLRTRSQSSRWDRLAPLALA